MWKLIIVEDEPKVRNGLKKVLPWESYEISVEGLFSNGEDALNYLMDNDVDIILTDIRMPKMDGIELIKAVRKNDLPARILVLSGFDDYEYLKEAIKYNVTSYMLKPLDIDELTANIEAAALQLYQDREASRLKAEGVDSIRNTLFQRVLQNGVHEAELRSKLKFLEIQGILDWDLINPGIVRFFDHKNLYDKQISYHDKLALFRTFTEHFADENVLAFIDRDENLVILAADSKMIESASEYISLICTARMNCRSIVFWGKVSDSLDCLGESYSVIYKASLETAVPEDCSGFLTQSDLTRLGNEKYTYAVPVAEIDRIIAAGDAEAMLKLLDSIVEAEEEFIKLARHYFRTIMYITGSIQKTAGDSRSVFDELQISFHDFLMITSHEGLMTYGKRFCLKLERIFLSPGEGTGNQLVDDMMMYIKRGFSRGISLKEYAFEKEMSAAYLGKLFYSETGKKFTGYVQELRMAEACRLLSETSFRISEIASMLGFSDSHYFLKIFSLTKGCTPTEYRNPIMP